MRKGALLLLAIIGFGILAGCGDPTSESNKEATAKRFDNLNKEGKGDPASR